MLLTRDQILAAQDCKTETVPVPEWGGDVCVRTMGRSERDAFEDSLAVRKGGKRVSSMANFTARLLALCLVDESGKMIFAAEDVELLGKKSAAAMQRLLEVASRLNGFGDAEVAELTKNS